MQNKNETVVLLHGILRTDSCMRKLEDAFKAKGYNTLNVHYPSRSKSIELLATEFLAKKLKDLPKSRKINFVTHSMGGLLVHAYLSKHKMKNVGRVVMLSPPHSGSEIVDFFKRYWLLNIIFKAVFGDAGQQLGTNMDKKQFKILNKNKLPFELGIIAGSIPLNPIGFMVIKQPSDGTVSVESTKIEGMKSHITLPVDHLFMVKNKQVIKQTLNFIKNGSFTSRL